MHHLLFAAAPNFWGNLGNISGLVGFGLPLLIAVIQQEHWRKSIRAAVGFAACLVGAAVTCAVEHKLNTHDYIESALIVFALAKTSYLSLWKNTVAPSIEHATSFGGSNHQGPPPVAAHAAPAARSRRKGVGK